MAVQSDALADPRFDELEQYRRELTGYCYRMLGSAFEAEDAVQEAMVRAWKGIEQFDGRASLKSWLYRIATNVSLDMLRSRQRRARPMEMGPLRTADTPIGEMLPDGSWITPIPDERVVPESSDPAEVAAARESIRLAFVAALHHLPPKQRAVLILREVLHWQASEVAELLDTTVASVNSALQRARATLAGLQLNQPEAEVLSEVDPDQQALLAAYVQAFERYDIESLVKLLHEDAIMSMPPFDFWLRGPVELGKWFVGQGSGCEGSRLLVTKGASGCAAFGSYKPAPGGGHAPFALQVIETSGDRIVGHHNFLDPELFGLFGLPEHLD